MEPKTRLTKSVALAVLLVSALTIFAPTVDADDGFIVADETLHPEDAEALAELIRYNLALSSNSVFSSLAVFVEIEIHEDPYNYDGVSYVEWSEEGDHDVNYRVSYAVNEEFIEQNDFFDYNDMDFSKALCFVAVVSCGEISNGTSWASNNLDLQFDNVRFLWETRECREIADMVGGTRVFTTRWLNDNDDIVRYLEESAFVIEQ